MSVFTLYRPLYSLSVKSYEPITVSRYASLCPLVLDTGYALVGLLRAAPQLLAAV